MFQSNFWWPLSLTYQVSPNEFSRDLKITLAQTRNLHQHPSNMKTDMVKNAFGNLAKLESGFLKVALATQHALNATESLVATFDNLTREHTAFQSFSQLVHAEGDYFPSLHKAPEGEYDKNELVFFACGRTITRELQYAELDLLALAYDMAQEARGDSRRAHRS